MDGTLTYGPMGRLISVLAMISAFVGALEASGYVRLLPDKYAWVGLLVTVVGLFIAGFSERIQGGASKPEVRAAAEGSDQNNVREAMNQ